MINKQPSNLEVYQLIYQHDNDDDINLISEELYRLNERMRWNLDKECKNIAKDLVNSFEITEITSICRKLPKIINIVEIKYWDDRDLFICPLVKALTANDLWSDHTKDVCVALQAILNIEFFWSSPQWTQINAYLDLAREILGPSEKAERDISQIVLLPKVKTRKKTQGKRRSQRSQTKKNQSKRGSQRSQKLNLGKPSSFAIDRLSKHKERPNSTRT